MGAAEEQAQLVHRHSRLLAGQTGVLVGIGGVPLSLELFDSPLTLREQYHDIVRAAALDALGMPAMPTPDRLARQACSVVERTALDIEPRVGQLARLGYGSASAIEVTELEHRYSTVHLQALNQEHPELSPAA